MILDRDDADEQYLDVVRKLVWRTNAFCKLAMLHSVENEAHDRSVAELLEVLKEHQALRGAGVSLILAPTNVFVNRRPIRLTDATMDAAYSLRRILCRLRYNEFVFRDDLNESRLRAFLGYFKAAAAGADKSLDVNVASSICLNFDDSLETADVLHVDESSFLVRAFSALVMQIESTLFALSNNMEPDLVGLRRSVQLLAEASNQLDDNLIAIARLQTGLARPEYHLACVAAMVLVMGRRLKATRPVLAELMMGAVLHDTGRRALPGVEDDGFEQALEGVRSVSVFDCLSGHITLGGLHRASIAHEHAQPAYGEAGPRPNTAAQIIGVACAFDTMTQTRAPGMGLPPEAAMRYLLYSAGGQYGYRATRLLASTLGVFPVGTPVALSNGVRAVVVEGPVDPTRLASPVVRTAAGERIDTSTSPLQIVRSLGPVSVEAVVNNFLIY